MAKEVISDFLMSMGFDGSKVEAGLKKLTKLLDNYEKKVKKINTVLGGVGTGGAARPSSRSTMYDSHVKALEKQINLQDKLKNKTEAYLNTARVRRGINSGLIDEGSIRSQLGSARSSAEYRNLQTKMTSDLALKQAAVNAKLKEQNYLLQRGVTSTKQMLGNYVSAFAVGGALSNITKIGQDFESVQSTFQSVSDSSKDASENLQFVRDQVNRLGIDYRENAKGFAQMLAANQGQLQKSDLKELFLGVAESSTVLGLSMEDQTGTIKALSQMLGKTKVMAKSLATYTEMYIYNLFNCWKLKKYLDNQQRSLL